MREKYYGDIKHCYEQINHKLEVRKTYVFHCFLYKCEADYNKPEEMKALMIELGMQIVGDGQGYLQFIDGLHIKH